MDTPSGFALYIAKKVNPNLRTINGFSAVRINNIKLLCTVINSKRFLPKKVKKLARQAPTETKQENHEKRSQYVECKSLDSEFATSDDEKIESQRFEHILAFVYNFGKQPGNSMHVFNLGPRSKCQK